MQINATCGPPGLVWVSGRCYYPNITNERSVVENTRQRDAVVPNIVHMIKFGSESLELFVYLNFLSILEHIKPEVVYIHQVGNQSKESRESWNNILSHPIVKVIETSQNVEIFGITPHYLDFAHQADIIRMKALKKYGGIYLDFDTLILRNFDDFRYHHFTLGKQATIGLINAIIISSKESRFLNEWYQAYRYVQFSCWDCHSVRLPCQIALNYPYMINIVDEVGFLCPYHRGVLYENEVQSKEMHCTVFPYEGKFAQHLWHHTIKGRKYLHGLTIDLVCSGNSVYHKMLRFALNTSKWFNEKCVNTSKSALV